MTALPYDQIHPGMPADVMIVTGQSSPAQYLLEPLLNLKSRALAIGEVSQ